MTPQEIQGRERTSIFDRAREALKRREQESDDLQASWDRQTSSDSAKHANYVIGFDPPVETEEMAKLSDGWERTLWGFEREGLTFIAGRYWNENGGDNWLLAAKPGRLPRRRPEWPPPSPRSASNTGWAPKGFKPLRSIADLAEFAPAPEHS